MARKPRRGDEGLGAAPSDETGERLRAAGGCEPRSSPRPHHRAASARGVEALQRRSQLAQASRGHDPDPRKRARGRRAARGAGGDPSRQEAPHDADGRAAGLPPFAVDGRRHHVAPAQSERARRQAEGGGLWRRRQGLFRARRANRTDPRRARPHILGLPFRAARRALPGPFTHDAGQPRGPRRRGAQARPGAHRDAGRAGFPRRRADHARNDLEAA